MQDRDISSRVENLADVDFMPRFAPKCIHGFQYG